MRRSVVNSRPSPLPTFTLAVAVGLTVANLYCAQPLAGLIAGSLGLDGRQTGLVVTVAQAGYCAGLLLMVPLGDLIENRRLVIGSLGVAALALATMAMATSRIAFLVASFVAGLASAAA